MTLGSCVYTVPGREVELKARRSSTSPPARLRREAPPPPPADALRTFALVGHRSAGKTSLAEMLLQAGRVVREPGEVASGTTLLDWSPSARRHRQTIELSTAWFDWEVAARRDGLRLEPSPSPDPRPGAVASEAAEQRFGVQLIDTPGAACFAHARDLALESAEAAVVVVDAAAGVEIGTEEAFATARRLGLPVIVVLAKVDRDHTDADLAGIGAAAGVRAVPLQLPFRDEDGRLAGVVDVLGDRALRFADDGAGTWSPEPVPERLAAEVAAARERVTEAVAVTDDALLEQYLEYLELPIETVRQALVGAVRRRAVVPVLLTSAAARIGAGPLLDVLVELVPPLSEARREVAEFDGSTVPLSADGPPVGGLPAGSPSVGGLPAGSPSVGGLPAGSPFVARVLSEHRDEDGAPWHLVRVLAGTPPRGDWIEGRAGLPHKIRKCYRVRGPRRQALFEVRPGLILGTWDPLPVPAGTTLTDGKRWEVVGAAPRPPMMALAVRPDDDRHRAKVDEGLRALVRADRGLALHTDAATGAVLLAGADEAHLRLSIERLEAWVGVAVKGELPPVGYVETPAGSVEGVEGLHVRADDDGLVEEYGRCEITLDSASTDGLAVAGLDFEDTLGDVEDDLPRRFRPAVDEGARAAMLHGPTAGYPVVGVKLKLTGGAYDMLQSTDEHFRLAGEKAVRAALERAGTRLLEPWSVVEVHTPAGALGNVINDISAHRGRILGMTVDGDVARLEADLPYRELRTFGPRLQTLTNGRGRFEIHSSHYQPVPSGLVDEAIRSSPHATAKASLLPGGLRPSQRASNPPRGLRASTSTAAKALQSPASPAAGPPDAGPSGTRVRLGGGGQ